MKKDYIPPKKIIVVFGILFVGIVIGIIIFFQMIFGTWYERITSGSIYNKYMGKRFEIIQMEKDKVIAKKSNFRLLFYLSSDREYSGYEFVPYSFVGLSIPHSVDINKYVATFKEPQTYEVIDLYSTTSFGGTSNIAICIIQGVPELEDIVFEKRVENKVIPYRPGIDDIDVTDQTKSEWTEERYQKVLKSKRNKIRGILKYIKPGDRTKKVRGVIW